MKYKE